MTEWAFAVPLSVRDYECDMQGIVNNAVYQNYFEHARHEFLKARGLDFAAITIQGLNLVVARIEIDYLRSLRSGDTFAVRLRVERLSRLRCVFFQEIVRSGEERPAVQARVVVTGVTRAGRPCLPPELVDQIL